MKLYTEEQVRKAIELSRETHPEGRSYTQTEQYDYSYDEVVELLTPIELPSDEEIKKESMWLDNPLERLNYQEGMKWMRNKIQGGNK